MTIPKRSRRKGGANKLEPIDWHEFANDAVLNGNMSTLYHRPLTEDPTTYASPEALREIEKRIGRPAQTAVVMEIEPPGESTNALIPTVGSVPTVGAEAANYEDRGVAVTSSMPTVGIQPRVSASIQEIPTVGIVPTVGMKKALAPLAPEPALPIFTPTEGCEPTVGSIPTVGMESKRKVKPIRDVQDALTLAGQVLYKTMYGIPDGAKSKNCTKGYRQLAAETHLDKDTVRDLISEFKEKGLVRETGTYDPDTRSAKTYDVLSYKAILQMWRDAGIVFVITGRQRPMFCTAQGEPLIFRPTVGTEPTARRQPRRDERPTVGAPVTEPRSPDSAMSEVAQTGPLPAAEVIQALQQIIAGPVDQEAADRLIKNCRTAAADCTIDEIVEFAWSKAFLCRSGKIENPVGFLITQVPKHFQGEALQAYRDKKRKELDAAAEMAVREEERCRKSEWELAELEERHRVRTEIAERHRKEQGVDLKSLLQDSEADEVLQEWAKRMLQLGHRYQPRYD